MRRNAPVWTRLEARGPNGKLYQAPGAILDRPARNRPGGGPWRFAACALDGEGAVEAAAGTCVIAAEPGLENERAKQVVNVSGAVPAKCRSGGGEAEDARDPAEEELAGSFTRDKIDAARLASVQAALQPVIENTRCDAGFAGRRANEGRRRY